MSSTPPFTRANFLATGIQPAAPQSSTECSICCEPLAQNVVRTVACSHTFHEACIEQWTAGDAVSNRTCPLCRERLFRISEACVSTAPYPWPPGDLYSLTRSYGTTTMGGPGQRRYEDREVDLLYRPGRFLTPSDPPAMDAGFRNYEQFTGSNTVDRTAPGVNERRENPLLDGPVPDPDFDELDRTRRSRPDQPFPRSQEVNPTPQYPSNPLAKRLESSRRRTEEVHRMAEEPARILRNQLSQHPPGSTASYRPYSAALASTRPSMSELQRRLDARGEARLRNQHHRETTLTPGLNLEDFSALLLASRRHVDEIWASFENIMRAHELSREHWMSQDRNNASQHPQVSTASQNLDSPSQEPKTARNTNSPSTNSEQNQTPETGESIEEVRTSFQNLPARIGQETPAPRAPESPSTPRTEAQINEKLRTFFLGPKPTTLVCRELPSRHQSGNHDREPSPEDFEHASHTPPTPINNRWPSSLRDALPQSQDAPDQLQPLRTPATPDRSNIIAGSTTSPTPAASTMPLNPYLASLQHGRRAVQPSDSTPFNYQQFGTPASHRRHALPFSLRDPLPPLGNTSQDCVLERQEARMDLLSRIREEAMERERKEDAELERLTRERGL